MPKLSLPYTSAKRTGPDNWEYDKPSEYARDNQEWVERWGRFFQESNSSDFTAFYIVLKRNLTTISFYLSSGFTKPLDLLPDLGVMMSLARFSFRIMAFEKLQHWVYLHGFMAFLLGNKNYKSYLYGDQFWAGKTRANIWWKKYREWVMRQFWSELIWHMIHATTTSMNDRQQRKFR